MDYRFASSSFKGGVVVVLSIYSMYVDIHVPQRG